MFRFSDNMALILSEIHDKTSCWGLAWLKLFEVSLIERRQILIKQVRLAITSFTLSVKFLNGCCLLDGVVVSLWF